MLLSISLSSLFRIIIILVLEEVQLARVLVVEQLVHLLVVEWLRFMVFFQPVFLLFSSEFWFIQSTPQ
jgi:hypothetical protein